MTEPFPGHALLLSKYPYYAHILSRMKPLHDPAIGSIGVSARGSGFYLHLDLDFVAEHHDCLLGLMLHEVHHVVLGHLTHPRFAAAAHPDLMDLAMELSANEYVDEPLPGRPVRIEDLAQLDIRSRQSTMERYERLVTARHAGVLPPAIEFETVDAHHADGVGHAAMSPPGDHGLLRELVAGAIAEGGSDGAHGRLIGQDPGHLLQTLDRRPALAFVDWKDALQRFLAHARTPVHTYGRPSRRLPAMAGLVPGRMWYPAPGNRPHLLAAIDTSGSMGEVELAEIAAQLRLLHGLTRITVVECDVRIQRVYPFTGRIDSIAGRGGTDFRPVFHPRFLAEHEPDGVIYFSDGWGHYPDEDPGVRTLWVLTEPGEFACPWGHRAVLRWSA